MAQSMALGLGKAVQGSDMRQMHILRRLHALLRSGMAALPQPFSYARRTRGNAGFGRRYPPWMITKPAAQRVPSGTCPESHRPLARATRRRSQDHRQPRPPAFQRAPVHLEYPGESANATKNANLNSKRSTGNEAVPQSCELRTRAGRNDFGALRDTRGEKLRSSERAEPFLMGGTESTSSLLQLPPPMLQLFVRAAIDALTKFRAMRLQRGPAVQVPFQSFPRGSKEFRYLRTIRETHPGTPFLHPKAGLDDHVMRSLNQPTRQAKPPQNLNNPLRRIEVKGRTPFR